MLEQMKRTVSGGESRRIAGAEMTFQSPKKQALEPNGYGSSNIAQSSAEVMAVFKDCHQRLLKVLLK